LTNPRHELITLLRGAFACPVLSFLGRRGFAESLTDGGLRFDANDRSADALVALLHYLVALGLLYEEKPLQFRVTDLGSKVLHRFGAFSLLDSYNDYFRDLDWALPASTLPRPSVNRERNVIGSGQLHARKFFPEVLTHLATASYEHLTDLGCGDGTFIHDALAVQPTLTVTAVDLSEQAIDLVRKRFSSHKPQPTISTAISNAREVSTWAPSVTAGPEARHLITMWFLLHEIFDGVVAHLADFFRQLRRHFPAANIAFGELVRLSPDQLAASRDESIMPEYLLFHALSGQHPLSEQELSELLEQIPYRLVGRKAYDSVLHGARAIPSSVVCILTPDSTG